MEENSEPRLRALEEKVNAIFVSVEKTRKYFLIVLWVTAVMVVLPVVGLVFAIPMFLNSYLGAIGF